MKKAIILYNIYKLKIQYFSKLNCEYKRPEESVIANRCLLVQVIQFLILILKISNELLKNIEIPGNALKLIHHMMKNY